MQQQSSIIMPTVMKLRMPFSVKQVFVSNDKGDNLDRLPYKHCLCHNDSDDLKC
jgi:hypothetical protein